jgi:hypothetical protein
MFTKLNEFLNNVDLRKLVFTMLIVIVIQCAWNCYLSCKLQVVEGMTATTPTTDINNLAKLASYITEDGNSFNIPGNLVVDGTTTVNGDAIVVGNTNIDGDINMKRNKGIAWSSPGDNASIKYIGDSEDPNQGNNLVFETNDDNQENFIFQHKYSGDAEPKELMKIDTNGDLFITGNNIHKPLIQQPPPGGALVTLYTGQAHHYIYGVDTVYTDADVSMDSTDKIEAVHPSVEYRIRVHPNGQSYTGWSDWIGSQNKTNAHDDPSVMVAGKYIPGLPGIKFQNDILRYVEVRYKPYLRALWNGV